ncbi:MAG: NAD-dependent epimerase/dehydratase family protein [Verrucomicrobiota bacterium]
MTTKILGDAVQSVFVSGGSGFIGSHIVDLLLAGGYRVTAFDNLSNGREAFIEHHKSNPNFTFVKGDMLDLELVKQHLAGHDLAWHMAANTDIIGCHEQPDRDLKDCLIATFNMVEAMRCCGVRDILFASTGAVYGDLCHNNPTSESTGPLMPISCYAAGKIGSEAFISAYCHLYGLRGWMYRFGNVIGSRMTHGVIYDFIRKLKATPDHLEILGDGTQQKNYFLTEECIQGICYGYQNITMTEDHPCDVFNLGTDSVTPVTRIAELVIREMGLEGKTRVTIQGAKRAWPGDQPRVHINVDRMRQHGWSAKLSSDQAVTTAIRRMLGKSDTI